MKKTSLILIGLITVAVSLTGCKKDDDNKESTPNNPAPLVCQSTVTDADGNTYDVIKIGNLCWMKQNLKTTKYNDGSPIQTNLSDTQWQNTSNGAYAIYDDDPANDATYGKLYNGHAVATGKLCPAGWRIPTDQEWKDLESALGMSTADLDLTGERGNVGGKMKSTSLWDPPNAGASNSSDFSALPAGNRSDLGEYVVIRQYTDFWSSTEYATDNNYLWMRTLYYNGEGVGRNYVLKNKGYSCRCVRS